MIRFPALVLALSAGLLLAGCEDDQTRAEGYYQSALELMQDGDVDRALIELRNVFLYDGFHREARQLYADTVLAQGNTTEAYSQYLLLIEQYPDLVAPRITLAELSLAAGNWDEFERHTTAAAELAPDDPKVHALIAMQSYRQAVLDDDPAARAEAVDAARAVLDENPDLLIARRITIDALASGRTPTAALPEVDRALEVEPDSYEFNLVKFRILAQAERQDEAGAQLERLYELFPENEDIRNTLISWNISLGDLDAAEALLRDMAAAAEDPVAGNLTVVQFLMQAKGRDAASAEIDRLITTADGTPAADTYRAMKATITFDAGDRDAAIAELERITTAAERTDETRRIEIVLAQMYNSTGNQVGARALIETLLEEDTTNVDALKMRAAWLIDADQPDAAINDLRTALSQSPRDADVLTLMATAHERAGDTELAGERLSLAVEVSGARAPESLRYASFLLADGRTQAAESILLDARRADPGNLDVLSALADLWLSASDWTRLQDIRATLETIDTEEARTLTASLGTAIALGQNRLDDAAQMIDRFASADQRSRATIAVVLTQMRTGKMEEGRALLAQALEETPDDPSLRLLHGSVLLQDQDFDGAEAVFRAVMADTPGAAQPIQMLYNLLSGQGRTDEAAAVLDTALQDNPDMVDLLLLRAAVQERDNDIDGAIATYETIYAANSGNVMVANNLASLIADHRADAASLDRAFGIARRLRGLENPALQDTYGWIEYRRGNFDEAIANLEPAATGLPDNAMVQYHLGMAYVAQGRIGEARDALSRAITLAGNSPLPQFDTARETLASLGTQTDGAGTDAPGTPETDPAGSTEEAPSNP